MARKCSGPVRPSRQAAPPTLPPVVTAGAPGSFDKDIPANLAALNALGIGTGARWATGEYVVLTDGSEAFWDGAAFQSGRATSLANPSTVVTPGAPGAFNNDVPGSLAVLNGLTLTSGNTTKWATGQYVVVGDGTEAHWNGTTFAVGRATNPSTVVTAGVPGGFDKDIPAILPF